MLPVVFILVTCYYRFSDITRPFLCTTTTILPRGRTLNVALKRKTVASYALNLQLNAQSFEY